jgi:hypothetical protein
MADMQVAQAPQMPQQVVQAPAAPPTQLTQVDMGPAAQFSEPQMMAGFEAPSLQASMDPNNFDVEKVLGLPSKQQSHGYPDWFGKMIQSEVEAA